jgi:hypothetical protein
VCPIHTNNSRSVCCEHILHIRIHKCQYKVIILESFKVFTRFFKAKCIFLLNKFHSDTFNSAATKSDLCLLPVKLYFSDKQRKSFFSNKFTRVILLPFNVLAFLIIFAQDTPALNCVTIYSSSFFGMGWHLTSSV